MDRHQQAIAAPRDRLDISRIAGVVAEGAADLRHRVVEDAVVGIAIFAPDRVEDVVPLADLTRVLRQVEEDGDGLVGQALLVGSFGRGCRAYGFEKRPDDELAHDEISVQDRGLLGFVLVHGPLRVRAILAVTSGLEKGA